MVPATSNRLLPFLVGTVMLMLVFVSLKSCKEESDETGAMGGVPTSPAPDADTPADTIKTLTANVAAMTAEVVTLRQDNATLRETNEALLEDRTQIEDSVAMRVKRELSTEGGNQDFGSYVDPGVLATLTARVDALSASLGSIESERTVSDIPIGLGYDVVDEALVVTDEIVWVEPLDGADPAAGEGGLLESFGQLESNYDDPGETWTGTPYGARVTDEAQSRAIYTVPRNATLIGSTAMTAMVGRIPIDGEVRDPMPFKVITGAQNLAANGLTIPGVHGMVWSGTAIGDWTLACVTGRLDSVTFVFDDGTIRTIPDDEAQARRSGAEDVLGWISDAQGIPCITGARKTNAPSFLAQRIGITAVGAAAQAAAAAETTSVLSNAGTVTDRVTGETGAYVLGKTVAGGSDEVTRWLLERQSQSFDAVFVPAGTELAIHVDRALNIDFDSQGESSPMSHQTNAVITLVLISLGLSGCAGTKDSVLPQDGPTMKAIYETHFESMGMNDPNHIRAEVITRPTATRGDLLEGYTRDAVTELDTTFPRLPNPSLVMYVFPHLAGPEQVPVPGYSTTFPMYERVEYALPGETFEP